MSARTVKLPYWIQRADFSASDHEPIDLVGAESVLRNHDWQSEWALQDAFEREGKEIYEDYCLPCIGFLGENSVLVLIPNRDGTADCDLVLPTSRYAMSKAERVGDVLIVTDPDSSRLIASAPLLLQYRVLQLHFRPDQDALEFLFDDYAKSHD